MTYRDLLLTGTQTLKNAGIDECRADAKLLLLHAAGMTSTDLLVKETDPVPADVVADFLDMVERRAKREPVSNITRLASFFGRTFISDERALTPRADSEVLVETALDLLKSVQAPRLVDLGTGTGCLILSVLCERADATGVAIDGSMEALSLAQENAERLKLTSRIELQSADWNKTELDLSAFDLVISNPPYITEDEMTRLSPEVLDYDPHFALLAGPDGLDAYRRLIKLASAFMKHDAWIVFEIGWTQASAISNLLAEAGFSSTSTRKDYAGNDRVVYAQRCSNDYS